MVSSKCRLAMSNVGTMSALEMALASGIICAVFAATIGGRLAWCDDIPLSHAFGGSTNDQSYERLPQTRDGERRLERIADNAVFDVCDVESLAGMPQAYAEQMSEYTRTILTSLGAAPLSRQRFFVAKEGDIDFPFASHPMVDRNVPIPVVLIPRPEAVSRWSASIEARGMGWRSMKQALENVGSVYGRTLIFDKGPASKSPLTTPSLPHESAISPGLFVYSDVVLRLGKLVASPSYGIELELEDVSADLALGKPGGAKLRAEFLTTPVFLKNSRLRWVSIRTGKEVRQFLAYALVDGNGACRPESDQFVTNGISSFVRPLKCSGHQPKVQRHDELLLPTPKGWPGTYRLKESVSELYPYEDWCLDDWFPAQKDACWVIREAEDSKPLQESFLLMPASEKSDRPVFFIALFAETEPKQLVKELAALYKVSPDKALNSPETMARLQALYEKVRDFPLDK